MMPFAFVAQRLSNGSVDPDSDVHRVVDLQETGDKQTTELSTAHSKVQELNVRIAELEESLASTQKDLIKTQEQNVKLQRDIRESIAQKEDQEERIATLEKRYINAQRETTAIQDVNAKIESELALKDAHLKTVRLPPLRLFSFVCL
jgi:chromosome segregation ATPase